MVYSRMKDLAAEKERRVRLQRRRRKAKEAVCSRMEDSAVEKDEEDSAAEKDEGGREDE